MHPQADRPDADAESLIASIADFRESMHNATQKMLDETEEALESDKIKIEKARQLAEQTGVHRAICTMLRELWHVPPSPEGETPEPYHGGDTPLRDVYCVENKADDVTKLYYFTFNGTPYSVSFRYDAAHQRNFKPEAGRVVLQAGGKVLCSMSIRQTDGLSASVWVPHEIERLVIGAWVRHVVEIEEMIKAQRERFWVRFNSEFIHQQADGLPD